MAGFNIGPYGASPSAMGTGVAGFTGDVSGADTAGGSPVGRDWFSTLFGGKDADGNQSPNLVGMGLGAAQGAFNAYNGMKMYGLAKDQLQFSKDTFEKNFAAQQAMTNNTIGSTNIARAASREGASNPYQPLKLVG